MDETDVLAQRFDAQRGHLRAVAVTGADGRIERVPYELCVLRSTRGTSDRRNIVPPGSSAAGSSRTPSSSAISRSALAV